VRGDARVFHLVHRAGLCVDELFAFFVGFEGPSSRQYAILSAMARGEGKSQARIVSATGIDRSTMSSMVRRLLRKGWLSRHRAKNDGRAYAVELTVSGRKALKGADHAARETDSMLLATVSPRRRSIFLKGLRKIIEVHSAP
jgi:DNA-binding MarR family transcriptional regulator